MKAKRKNKGEQYFFISRRTMRPVLTRDEYFESDDQRYDDENYFLTKNAAYSCADDIREQYGEKLEKIAYNKEMNDRSFIKAVKALPERYNLKKAQKPKPDETPNEEKKRAAKAQEGRDACIFDLLCRVQEHDDRKAALDNEYKSIMAAIEDIIADAEKE